MEDVKVSVIIPVYNTEKYLEECLDSVVNQSLKEIEVICVNDGSTDNSLSILKEYEKKDNRITLITQPNSGSGRARNRSLKIAKGKYVYYLDSDDFLKTDALEKLYNFAEQKKADIVMFKAMKYIDDTKEYTEDRFHNMDDIGEKVQDNIFDYTDIREFLFTMSKQAMSKFFRRSFLIDIDAQFADKLIFQDTVFCFKAILLAKRMYYVPEHFCYRRVRRGSVTQDYDNRYPEMIQITDKIIEVFEDIDKFDEFEDELYNHKLFEISKWFVRTRDEFKEPFFLKIKEHFQLIKNDKELYDNYMNNLEDYYKSFFENALKTDNINEFNLLMEIYRLEQESKSLKETISNFDEENGIDILKEKNDEIEEYNNSLMNTWSWKLTAPLRKITYIIKKILN